MKRLLLFITIFMLSSCNQELETGRRSDPNNPFSLISSNQNNTTNGNTGAPTDNGIGSDNPADAKPKL